MYGTSDKNRINLSMSKESKREKGKEVRITLEKAAC